MIKKVKDYLKEHAGSIYKDSPFPSVAKVLHHGRNEKDILNFYKKYKVDTDMLNRELFQWINQNETNIPSNNANSYNNQNNYNNQNFGPE